MRGVLWKTLIATGLLSSLGACQMFPVGPDLAKAPSPFGTAPSITLGDPDKPGDQARIIHTATGDTTVITLGEGSPRGTYDAGVTWLPFDGQDADHDYWLIGLNVFRTADRAAYILIRYPHGLKIAAPMTSDAFEMLPLTCDMRGVSPFGSLASDDTVMTNADGSPAEVPAPEAEADAQPADAVPPAEQPQCDFKDLDEVRTFVPTVLQKAQDQAAQDGVDDEDKDGDYHWDKTRVTIP